MGHEEAFPVMKPITWRLTWAWIFLEIFSGCSLFRYAVIPQEKRGPHGGAVVLIDRRVPEYIEFVTVPGKAEWTFQVFSFDQQENPQSISGPAHLELILPSGSIKKLSLWNTKQFFWTRGIAHLENKMELSDLQEFKARVTLQRNGRFKDHLEFNYPQHDGEVSQKDVSGSILTVAYPIKSSVD